MAAILHMRKPEEASPLQVPGGFPPLTLPALPSPVELHCLQRCHYTTGQAGFMISFMSRKGNSRVWTVWCRFPAESYVQTTSPFAVNASRVFPPFRMSNEWETTFTASVVLEQGVAPKGSGSVVAIPLQASSASEEQKRLSPLIHFWKIGSEIGPIRGLLCGPNDKWH